jgi:hypothetical protein
MLQILNILEEGKENLSALCKKDGDDNGSRQS